MYTRLWRLLINNLKRCTPGFEVSKCAFHLKTWWSNHVHTLHFGCTMLLWPWIFILQVTPVGQRQQEVYHILYVLPCSTRNVGKDCVRFVSHKSKSVFCHVEYSYFALAYSSVLFIWWILGTAGIIMHTQQIACLAVAKCPVCVKIQWN